MNRKTSCSRGQALIETAIMMPLMLLSLFAMLYEIHQGVVSERTALAARWSTEFSNGRGTFNSYSLASIGTDLTRNVITSTAIPCDLQPNGDVFTQTNGYNLSGTNKSVPLLQPNTIATASCNGLQYASPGTAVPFSSAAIKAVVSTRTANTDSSLFGPDNLFGLNTARNDAEAATTFNVFPESPILTMHCYPELLRDVGRSLKIHGIYAANGTPGYGNYVDDVAVQAEYPNGIAQPLSAGASYGAPAFDANCTSLDTNVQLGPGTDLPLGMWGGAWFLQQNNFQLGEPAPGVAVAPASPPPAGSNPPPGPLDTLPGPKDFNATDPGVGTLHGGV